MNVYNVVTAVFYGEHTIIKHIHGPRGTKKEESIIPSGRVSQGHWGGNWEPGL